MLYEVITMTINGPAPIILAMFLNTAVDQQVDLFRAREKREPSKREYNDIRSKALSDVRGTVQADILKEDQGQNTCIFSIEFALKMMGDIQEYFIDRITSYNVCYTKLLRNLSTLYSFIKPYPPWIWTAWFATRPISSEQ